MKRFNSSKVRALGNLQPMGDKQRAYIRRLNGIKMPFSQDRDPPAIKKFLADFLAPMRADWTPPKVRGANGSRISHAKRVAIMERLDRRAAFFAAL